MSEHTADIVNEPKHYARWKIEPINYIMRNGFEFWRGNIIKYASRAGYKPYEGMSKAQYELIYGVEQTYTRPAMHLMHDSPGNKWI